MKKLLLALIVVPFLFSCEEESACECLEKSYIYREDGTPTISENNVPCPDGISADSPVYSYYGSGELESKVSMLCN